MVTDGTDNETATLSPDDAFGVLGNETRMTILRTLIEAETKLSFSELRDRVGTYDSGQFNYHLGKVEGHFVEKTDDGYELKAAGRRVVEAVLAGAITDDPVLEPTRIDEPCPHCDTPIRVAYRDERLRNLCPNCPGHYGYTTISDVPGLDDDVEYGHLGSVLLPPAGLQERSAAAVQQAANTWGTLELLAIASRVCPRCSGPLDESVQVCESHASEGVCDRCDNRHAVRITFRCTNCLHERWGAFVLALLAQVDLLAFLTSHGLNPIAPSSHAAVDDVLMNYDEDVRSIDPFEAQFTFIVDGEALSLTVDDELSVRSATVGPADT